MIIYPPTRRRVGILNSKANRFEAKRFESEAIRSEANSSKRFESEATKRSGSKAKRFESEAIRKRSDSKAKRFESEASSRSEALTKAREFCFATFVNTFNSYAFSESAIIKNDSDLLQN